MIETVVACPACFRKHPTEQFKCSACGKRFQCASQFTTIETIGGGSITGHTRPANTDERAGEACGPVVFVAASAESALTRAKRYAGVA